MKYTKTESAKREEREMVAKWLEETADDVREDDNLQDWGSALLYAAKCVRKGDHLE